MIIDRNDDAPNAPEDKDGYQDGDGAPDPDNDGDGINDSADAAPNNPEDKDGYQDGNGAPDPDNDGDGIPDNQDNAPNTPEDGDSCQDGDGAPESDGTCTSDSDGDGIIDSNDDAPNEPEDDDGYQDGDGAPDPDNDGDGINDSADAAPNAPEDPDGIEDGDGMPETDADNDGLSDSAEINQYGTNPTQADTDGDGYSDSEEVNAGTNPNDPSDSPESNQPPSVSFASSPEQPKPDEQVTFDASGSSDPDGSIESYEWDFDSDGTTDATDQTVSRSFDLAGDYKINLTVTDNDGAMTTATQTLSVSEANDPGQPPENGANTLTIIGVNGTTNYGFSATGGVGEADGTVETQFADEIDGKTGSGLVGPSRESYTFTGKLIRLEVSDQAKVLLNGERIDPADYPDNILRVSGDGGTINYGFSASEASISEAVGSVEQQFADEIGDKTGSGVAGPAQDIYGFDGQLARLEVSGQATVILNGEQIDPANYPDDVLRISGAGGTINYEFAANRGVNEAYGVEQQFADRTGGNTGSGVAGPSEDAYAFTGDLTRLEVSGQATIIYNGERIDPADFPDNILTISGVGETVNYEFTASGDVGENFGVEQQFADRIESTTGNGVVGPGDDSYTFAGELRSLNVTGNAEVTVNGEEVNESDV